MNLAQLQTLKAAIAAEVDSTLVAARNAGDSGSIAAFYNANSTFVVWRSRVMTAELHGAYSWSEIIALTQGQSTALNLMLALGYLNAANANVRTGMAAIFTSSPTTLAAVTALGKRFATNGEKLYATGTGTNGSPGTLVIEQTFTNADIDAALRS